MAGLRCSDCIFCSCFRDKKTGLVQALCSRGYTLANPLCEHEPDMYFARDMRAFVPVVDPFGEMYLRTRNTCAQFEKRNTPLDENCLSEKDEHGNSRVGNALGVVGAAGAAGTAGAAAAAGADAVVAAGTAAGGTREAGGTRTGGVATGEAGVATVSGSAGTEAASDAVPGVASTGVSRTPGTASTASAERATHTTCAGTSSACKRSWLARIFSHRE